jgi:hypothetical protein
MIVVDCASFGLNAAWNMENTEVVVCYQYPCLWYTNFNTWIDLSTTASYQLQMLFKGENVATTVSYFKGLEGGWRKAVKVYFQSINRHSFGVRDKKYISLNCESFEF